MEQLLCSAMVAVYYDEKSSGVVSAALTCSFQDEPEYYPATPGCWQYE